MNIPDSQSFNVWADFFGGSAGQPSFLNHKPVLTITEEEADPTSKTAWRTPYSAMGGPQKALEVQAKLHLFRDTLNQHSERMHLKDDQYFDDCDVSESQTRVHNRAMVSEHIVIQSK